MGNKRKAILIILVLLGIVYPILGYSAPNTDIIGQNPGDIDPTLPPRPEPPSYDRSSGGLVSWLLNKLADGIASVLRAFGFEGVENLVFNNNRKAEYSVGDAFTSDEWDNLVMPWYRSLRTIALIPVVISIVVTIVGINFIVNPRAYAYLGETLLNFFIVVILLGMLPDLVKLLLQLNVTVVNMISGMLTQGGTLQEGAVSGSIMSALQKDPNLNPLTLSLVNLNLTFLTAYFNLLYVIRKLVIAVLLIVFPLAAWCWVNRKTRIPVLTIFSELLTNSLMTMFHAIVLAFGFQLIAYTGPGVCSAWWAKLVLVNMIIPLASLLRNLLIGWLNFLGTDEEKLARNAAFGIGALASVAKVGGTLLASGGATLGSAAIGAYTKTKIASDRAGNTTSGRVESFHNGEWANISSPSREQGYRLPIRQLPPNIGIGDRIQFQVHNRPGDVNDPDAEPTLREVRPLGSTSGGASGSRQGRYEPLARTAGSAGKLIGAGLSFGTPAMHDVSEFGVAFGYKSGQIAQKIGEKAPVGWRWLLANSSEGAGNDE